MPFAKSAAENSFVTVPQVTLAFALLSPFTTRR